MDEVDGSSRDTSTDGSSSGFTCIRPELHMKGSETMPRHHSSWSSSQPRREINCSPQLRGHNSSWSEGTEVNRTDLNYGPTVASRGLSQFDSQLVPRSVNLDEKRNAAESSLTSSPAGGSMNSKSSETNLPLSRQSCAESPSDFLFREDEPWLLRSEVGRQRPDSRNGLTLELKSDLNPQYDRDLDQNNCLQKLEGAVTQPRQHVDLREHLPKPDPTTQRETGRNVQTQGAANCQKSMTGSFIQQCSDFNDFESYGQFYRECYEGLGNGTATETRDVYNGASHLEHVIKTQDDLLRSRDQELLELKEANHRQSLFIEKILAEKRLLEATVVEQARLLMSSHGTQRVNTGPGRPAALSSAGNFDAQLYEAQLATYKEDFENERKEKLIIKGSVDSLNDQLHKALSELQLAQDKLKKTEEELERIRNPYRATYLPYLQAYSNHSNSTASSSSSQSAAASAHSKTPLYRKPDHLEPDRVNQTILATSTEMDHLSQMATVSLNDLIGVDQPCWNEKPAFTTSSHMCQKSQSSGQANKVEEISLTRQGQCDWTSHILAY